MSCRRDPTAERALANIEREERKRIKARLRTIKPLDAATRRLVDQILNGSFPTL